MNDRAFTLEIVASGFVVLFGLTFAMFAPAIVRFQIRVMEWQIELMKRPWAAWPLQFFGIVFALIGLIGLFQHF